MSKKIKVEKNSILQDDILRYKKNKFAANFALLALVLNCLYFTLVYAVHASDIYTLVIGGSVILNLVVLLAGFFSSEGIKSYNKKFAIALFVLAGIQIARIFVYPTIGMAKGWLSGNYYFGIRMTTASNGIMMILYLGASAACFILSGVYGIIMAQRLENFVKKVESGEIKVEDTIRELEEADRNFEAALASKEDSVEAKVDSREVDNG